MADIYAQGPALKVPGPTLTEIQVMQKPAVPEIITDTIISESSVLPMLPFKAIKGRLEYASAFEDTLPDVYFRQIGTWVKPSKATFRDRRFGLALMSGEVSVDAIIEDQESQAGKLAEQSMRLEKSMALFFEENFWTGVHDKSTRVGFNGVDAFLSDGFGGVVDISEAYLGQAVRTGNKLAYDYDDLDRLLDELRHKKDMASCLFMTRLMRQGFNSYARHGVSGVVLWDSGHDAHGNRFDTYDGIKVELFGDTNKGKPIKPADATDYTEDIYAVSFGTDRLCGVQSHFNTTVIPPSVQTSGPFYIYRFDWGIGIAAHSEFDVAKLQGGKPYLHQR